MTVTDPARSPAAAAPARYRIDLGALRRDRPAGCWVLVFFYTAGVYSLVRDLGELVGWAPARPAGGRLLIVALVGAACATGVVVFGPRSRAA